MSGDAVVDKRCKIGLENTVNKNVCLVTFLVPRYVQKVHEVFGSCCHHSSVIQLVIVSSPARSDPCPSSVCPGMAEEEGKTLICLPAIFFFFLSYTASVSVPCRAEPTADSGMEASERKKKDKKKETSEEQRRAEPFDGMRC